MTWFSAVRNLFARPAVRAEAAGPGASVGVDAAPAPPAVTPSLLRQLGVAEADTWAAALPRVCRSREIKGVDRLAAFLGTVLHESGNFSRLVENLNYSAEALMRTWPARFSAIEARRMGRADGHPADQRAIAERAYGGRMGNGPEGNGDGYLYRGRGLLQITGRDNYKAAAEALGIPLAQLPAWLETATGAAEASAWWWQAHGCNQLADAGDLVALRRRVNGGVIGLEDANRRIAQVRALLAAG